MANPRLGADEPSAYLVGGEASSKLYLGADLLWTNPTPPEPSGPLAVHWDFNDPSPTTSTDLIAGKVMSLNTMSKVASRNGTGLQSSSTTGMATVSEGLVNPAEFTITAWIYTTGQYAGLRFKSGGQAGASKIEMYGRYQISGSRMYLQTYQRAMVNGAWVLGYMNSNIQNATEILLTGHFHHFLARQTGVNIFTGRDKYHLQAPALDNGSAWYQNVSGESSKPGLMVFQVDENGFDLESLAIL